MTGAAYRTQGGMALVIVLWVLLLLSLMAAHFASAVRMDANLARNRVQAAQAQAWADFGVRRGILALLDPSPDTRWQVDGRRYEVAIPEGRLFVSLQSETGKVDLNRAPPALLDGLLATLGVPDADRPRLVDALLDWRDPDDYPRTNGAEREAYQQAGLPDVPRNAALPRITELAQVMGWGEALYQRVAPYVTVYSGRGEIDPRVAPATVLLAVPGLTPEAVEEYLRVRQSGTAEAAALLGGAEGRHFSQNPASVYTIRAEVRLTQGAGAATEAVITLGGGGQLPYAVLSWRKDKKRKDRENTAADAEAAGARTAWIGKRTYSARVSAPARSGAGGAPS